MTPEEFRTYGHKLIDWLADYREEIAKRPVKPGSEPGEVRALLPVEPPDEPQSFEAVLADLDRVVLPHLTHWQHPRFFGYFPANASYPGILADLVSSGLGVLGLSWEAAPALVEMEEVMVDWFRQILGLSPAFSGAINDTASVNTLIALLCARERASAFSQHAGGLQAEPAPLVVYSSASAHSSIEKGLMLAGFGRQNLRLIETDKAFAMRPASLAAAIQEDLAAGLVPCAVVATIGGTATTSLDPLADIGAIAASHGLWLHVDAAMAGSAMILPECRWMWQGVDAADSLVVNPHKWLGTPFDCSMLYVRDRAHLARVMASDPSYLQTAHDGKVRNLRDTGIALGRRFRALKLWFVIREEGVTGLQARLRRDLALASGLADEIRRAPHWQVLAPVVLQTICVRYQPPEIAPEELDAFTRRWAAALNASGIAYVTPAMADGRWMVRISVGTLATGQADMNELWAAMQRITADERKHWQTDHDT